MGIGTLMTPPWKVEPLNAHLTVENTNTAIHAKGITTPQEGTYQVKETHITLNVSDNKQVQAIVREPVGAANNRPACVFVHGAGSGKASEVYGDIASAMASAGITTLVQDKRLDNYTAFNRDYQANATDYLVGVNYLRHRQGVSASKVGVYAESEGTWITTIMAKRDPNLAFTVLVSAPVYSGRQQMAMAASEYLNIIGAPQAVENIVPKLTSLNFGSLGFGYADFDANDYRDALTMPLLIVYGTIDPSMPIEQGAQQLMSDARDVGNLNSTLRYYPTNHQIRTGSSLSLPGLQLAEGYTHDLENWVNAIGAGATADSWTTPSIAGSQPFQEYAVPMNIRPGLISNINVLFALFLIAILMWVTTVVSVVMAFMRRRKQSPTSTDAHGRTVVHRFTIHTRTLIVANMVLTPLTTLGFLAYFAYTARAALTLHDSAGTLTMGWVVLRCAVILSIILLCWLWVRMYFFYGPGNIDRETPKEETRMARGHVFIVALLSLCVISALILATFFNLIG